MVLDNAKYHRAMVWASKKLDWFATDSEGSFKEELPEDPNNKDLLYYKKNPITYKFNNYGFRSHIDFYEGMEGNIFLGCSHTFGIGHHLENVWSWKVNQAIGGNFINLSIGGSGISTAARILHAYKDFFKPKNIFLHHPHPYRYEHFNPATKRWVVYMCNTSNSNDIFNHGLNSSPYFKNMLLDPNTAKRNYLTNYYWIKNIAKDLGANFYCIPIVDNYKVRKGNIIPERARDQHHNVSYHTHLTNLFLDQIKNGYKENIPDYMFHYKWDVKRNLI